MTDQPHQQVLDDLHPQYTALRDRIRHVYKGFAQLSRAAFAPGNLDPSVKELIALAIGVAQGCDGCIASHAHTAVKAGVTKQQAAEAIGVTFLMHGGPATIYGVRAYTAFCEFFDTDHG
jgi:AhpD family alkylhydroperoxidase